MTDAWVPARPAEETKSTAAITDRPQSGAAGFETLDRLAHAAIASATAGLPPVSLLLAWQDWLLHLSMSPGKQLEIGQKRLRKTLRLAQMLAGQALTGHAEPCIKPLPQDHRFSHPGWQAFPFNIIEQSFLLTQQWWHNATTGVPGVSAHHERLVEFTSRQLLDMMSPSNFFLTNPEVMQATTAEGGTNLLRGLGHLADDLADLLRHKDSPDSAFQPGRDVAITPGDVVFRNALVELIQYRPTTPSVHAEPLLIVPAWIMKYYILDLSPQNSLIRHLVEQGYTVFCLSWINPDERHRDVSLQDYLQSGVMAALDAVTAITGSRSIHAAGYCLGGTLLSMAAAAMARDGDDRLKTLTLLAAQVDFEEPGELGLFIDESQLAFLEDLMWQQGTLDQRQMAGAFQLLNSRDLVWSRLVSEYLLGNRPQPNAMMAWNADATRMPYRMHADYLRQLYLDNDLSEGRFKVTGQAVHLEDIRVPVFAVGTTTDHVAPWKSVFKILHLFDTDVDFVLTSGGHNAGIVSEPGHAHRSYQTLAYRLHHPHPDAEQWAGQAEHHSGSWWPEWVRWLDAHAPTRIAATPTGNEAAGYPPLYAAPGHYVLIP